jgi:hypothetical protein
VGAVTTNAFPSPAFAIPAGLSDEKVFLLKNQQGMTLRDYFAAKAMLAFISEPVENTRTPFFSYMDEKLAGEVANASYRLAVAMLKERDK